MRAVLDANVLFPTVLREILTGVAAAGLYRPIWSARILEEWARATVKLGPGAEPVAREEITALNAAFPNALVRAAPEVEARLWLPDPADVHVLAVAVVSGADLIITFNAQDFPRHLLAEEHVERRDPDQFLLALRARDAVAVDAVAERVRAKAERLSGEPQPMRALLKRARLPRLGKAITNG